jgi:hypothetical protein
MSQGPSPTPTRTIDKGKWLDFCKKRCYPMVIGIIYLAEYKAITFKASIR